MECPDRKEIAQIVALALAYAIMEHKLGKSRFRSFLGLVAIVILGGILWIKCTVLKRPKK